MPPRHPSIAHALGSCRRRLAAVRSLRGHGRDGGAGTVGIHVACSGGPDSVALLGLLCLLRPSEGLRLSVGHVDHGLRPESAHEAALARRLAESMGLPFAVDRLELDPGPGLPARARSARRGALREQAQGQGAAFIALGHTATDQAETMLLHLARGAGLEGLAAMAEHDPWEDSPPGVHAGGPHPHLGGWLRPLLSLSRPQTRELATCLQLPFVDDPTNLQREHPRVRVRQELLPVLHQLNPQVELAFARAAAHARAAEEALQAWVDRELRLRRRDPPLGGDRPPSASPRARAMRDADASAARSSEASDVTSGPRWSTEGMEALPSAVRTRLVRRVCQAAGVPDDALGATTLASIDEALGAPGPRRSWDLHPYLRLYVARGELWTDAYPTPSGPHRRSATRAPNH